MRKNLPGTHSSGWVCTSTHGIVNPMGNIWFYSVSFFVKHGSSTHLHIYIFPVYLSVLSIFTPFQFGTNRFSEGRVKICTPLQVRVVILFLFEPLTYWSNFFYLHEFFTFFIYCNFLCKNFGFYHLSFYVFHKIIGSKLLLLETINLNHWPGVF